MYAHLSSLGVQEGQTVALGEKIGTMGQTGLAYGCHLHFSIANGYPYYGGTFLNPARFY